MTSTEQWEMFRSFPDRGPAEALRLQLERAEIPCRLEPRALESGLETHYCFFVARHLAHRARWEAARLPPTE